MRIYLYTLPFLLIMLCAVLRCDTQEERPAARDDSVRVLSFGVRVVPSGVVVLHVNHHSGDGHDVYFDRRAKTSGLVSLINI